MGKAGSEEDCEDKEGLQEGREEEGGEEGEGCQGQEAIWSQAQKRTQEEGDQGREEEVENAFQPGSQTCHLVQISYKYPTSTNKDWRFRKKKKKKKKGGFEKKKKKKKKKS